MKSDSRHLLLWHKMLITNLCFFVQVLAASGQNDIPKRRILFDITPVQWSLSEVIVENAKTSPFPHNHRNRMGFNCEITLLRNLRSFAFGLGLSSNSVRQRFTHSYTFPTSGGVDTQYNVQLDFYRLYLGPHGFVQFKQPDFEIGLRLGVYYPLIQNKCPDKLDRQATITNSQLGSRRAHLITKCYSAENSLTKALTEFEFMHRIYKQFWGGIQVTYSGWRQQERAKLYEFYLEEDLSWSNDSNDAPVVNDITIFEPSYQIGLNLRYDFNSMRVK